LQAAGLPIQEFPRTSAHTTLMGQTLFDLLNGRALRVYTADDLRQVETLRRWRIAKEKAPIEGKPKAYDRAAREAVAFCCKNQKVRFLTTVTL
jgi:hypothetical protein